MSKVYIKIDSKNRITNINGGLYEHRIDFNENWVFIDEGEGELFDHCQTMYLAEPILNEDGICRYKYTNGVIEKRTKEEIYADYCEAISAPSQLDRIEAQLMYTALMTDTLIEEG